MNTGSRENLIIESAPVRQSQNSVSESGETSTPQFAPGPTEQRLLHSQPVRPADVLALQRSVGNRAMQRILLRRRAEQSSPSDEAERAADAIVSGRSLGIGDTPPTVHRNVAPSATLIQVVQRQLPGFGTAGTQIPVFPEKPKELNWDVGPAGKVDNIAEGWDEKPNFPNGRLAHEGSSELDSGKTVFCQDWDTLQAAWNDSAHLSSLYNIQAKIPDVSVSEINGKPVETPKSVEAPKLENSRPAGKQGLSVGNIFNNSNELDTKTPFNPANLSDPDRAVYDQKKAAAIEARGNRIQAEIAIKSKMISVSTAWSQMRMAQIKEKQAEKGNEQKEIAVEKTITLGEKEQVETIIAGAEGILGAIDKKDVAGGVTSLAGTLTSLFFQDKIDQLNIKTARLDTEIAQLEVSYQSINVEVARDGIKQAMLAVEAALPSLDTAVGKEESAFNDFGATVGTLAKKLGLKADEAAVVRTAGAAMPKIDETIGQISQIETACKIPGYTSNSGVGAGLITNLETFKTHLANLKAFKNSLAQLKQTWIARRGAARSGTGLPENPASP
jgi:hypothetical protein